MDLAEALREVGFEVNEHGCNPTPVFPVFGQMGRSATVERPVIIARYTERLFLVVPLSVYAEGDIAEEWVVSAGSPQGMPRTILRLRDHEEEWVFLGPYRDPMSMKWPTLTLQAGVSKIREARESESVPRRATG